MVGNRGRRWVLSATIFVVVVAFAMVTVGAAEQVSTDTCREINGHKYCVVAVSTTPDSVAPGEAVTVSAIIENQGTKQGSVSTYLGLRGPDGDRWYPSGQHAYDIPVGERVTLEYTATLPSDASEGPYELTVDVWTGNDAEMFHTSGWLQQFEVTEPTTSAEVVGTAASGTYEPGERVPVTMAVENTGDTTHDFYVDTSLQRPNGNWITGEGTTLTLQPGARETVTLDVTVPDGASEGTYDAGSGVFYSSAKDQQYDYGHDSDAVTIEQANRAPDADRKAPSADITVLRGETVTFEIAASDTDGNLAGTEWYVDGDFIGDTRSIDGSTATGTVSRTFDTAGTYYVEGVVFDYESAYSSPVSWTVTVEQQTTDATITRTVADGTYRPGDSVPVEVAVENTGDTIHEFFVDASLQRPNGNWITGEKTAIELQPGEQETVTLDVDLPSDADAGRYTAGSGVFRTSAKDQRYDSGYDSEAVTVEEPTTDATIMRTSADGTYAPGDSVPVEVTIENTGDTTHDFYVDASLERPNGNWITGESTTVELGPGARETVRLSVNLPDSATEGEYTAGSGVFKTYAKDKRYDYGSTPAAVTVEPANSAPSATRGSSNGNIVVTQGETVEFELDVTDPDGNLAGVEWYIDGDLSDETQFIDGASDTETVSRAFDTPGAYTIEAVAFDSDRAYSSTVSWTVTVEEPTTNAAIIRTAADGTYEPGDQVPVEVTIENTGGTTHEFYVDASLQRPDGNWIIGSAATPQLDPGETRTVRVSVEVPAEASDGSFAAGSAVYASARKETVYAQDATSRTITVDRPTTKASVARIESDGNQFASGETVPVTVTVENTGETAREFSIDASLQLPSGDWMRGGEQTVLMQPGDRRTITLGVDIPNDAPGGTYRVGAGIRTSPGGELLDSATASDRITVERRVAASVTVAADRTGPFLPGERVPVAVTVENTGDTTYEFYTDASLQRPDGSWITGEAATVGVRPGAQRTVTLSVVLPEDAAPGSYDLGAGVFETRDADETIDTARGARPIRVEAQETTVTISEGGVVGSEFDPGDRVPVEVTINNEGTVTTETYVDASLQRPNGDWITGDGQTIQIEPGEEQRIRLLVPLPETAEGGTYVAAAAAYGSQRKETREAQATVADDVAVAGSAAATIVEADPAAGTYEPGSTATTELRVRNDGPVQNTFYVGYTLIGPDGNRYDGGDMTGRKVTIPSSQQASVSVAWSVPSDVPAGQYDMVATVWDETDPSNLETDLATVNYDEAFGVSQGGLSLRAISSERPAYEPGDLAIVQTTLTNNGSTTTEYEVTTAFTHLGASNPVTRKTQTVTLRPSETASLDFEWATGPTNRPGEYDISVQVRETDSDTVVAEDTVLSAFILREPNKVINIRDLTVAAGPYQPTDRFEFTTELSSNDDEDRLIAITYDVRIDGAWHEFHTTETVIDSNSTMQLEHDPPVPDYLEAGTYDLRVSVRGTDQAKYLYGRTVSERVLSIQAGSALVVEVRDESGAPLQSAHISLDREGTPPKLIGSDGTTRFTNLESGEVSVVAYPARYPRQSKVVNYEAGTTQRVVFSFGEATSVSGTLTLSDGTPLRNVVIDIDGNTARTDENGHFEFDEPLATGSTTVEFRVNGDRIGQRPVIINERTDSYDFQLQDRDPSEAPSSFARGALCGLGCSVEDAEDPSRYTAGWIASGFVAAGDVRDLVIALDTGQGGEAALAAFGLLPAVGDVSSALPKISRFSRVAKLSERLELQRFLGRIDQFQDTRVRVLNKLYDGTPATYLDETLGMSKQSIEELMTDGRNIERIKDSAKRLNDEYGFSSDRIRQYIKSGRNPEELEDAAQSRRLTDEAADPDLRVDGEVLEDIATEDDLAEVTASRRLAEANGARIAADLENLEDLEDGRYVIHATDTTDVAAIRSGDIDSMVVTKNGDTVTIDRVYEVYAGSNVDNAIKKKSQLNNRILPGLRQNADELGGDGITVQVADDLDGTVYLPEATATKEYPRAINEGDTVRDSIRRDGYNVRTFERTSDQFEQDYKALAGTSDTTNAIRGPAVATSDIMVRGEA